MFDWIRLQTWKKYKSLWSANISQLYSGLKTRLRKWMTTLQGIRYVTDTYRPPGLTCPSVLTRCRWPV